MNVNWWGVLGLLLMMLSGAGLLILAWFLIAG